MIQVKRAYEEPDQSGGARFLVERLWPRGMKKEALPLEAWVKDAAPSDDLRRWFQHDPAKWDEFRRRYSSELERHPEAWQPLLARARRGRITLVYSSHDTEHNAAIALQEFLQRKLKHKGAPEKAL